MSLDVWGGSKMEFVVVTSLENVSFSLSCECKMILTFWLGVHFFFISRLSSSSTFFSSAARKNVFRNNQHHKWVFHTEKKGKAHISSTLLLIHRILNLKRKQFLYMIQEIILRKGISLKPDLNIIFYKNM